MAIINRLTHGAPRFTINPYNIHTRRPIVVPIIMKVSNMLKLSRIAKELDQESPCIHCDCNRSTTFSSNHAVTCPIHKMAVKIVEGMAKVTVHFLPLKGL